MYYFINVIKIVSDIEKTWIKIRAVSLDASHSDLLSSCGSTLVCP